MTIISISNTLDTARSIISREYIILPNNNIFYQNSIAYSACMRVNLTLFIAKDKGAIATISRG